MEMHSNIHALSRKWSCMMEGELFCCRKMSKQPLESGIFPLCRRTKTTVLLMQKANSTQRSGKSTPGF